MENLYAMDIYVIIDKISFLKKVSQGYQDKPIRQKIYMKHQFQLVLSETCNLQQNLGQCHDFVLETEIKVEGPGVCDHVWGVYKNS